MSPYLDWVLSQGLALFRNANYSIAWVLNCISIENDKGVLIKKEMVITTTVKVRYII